MISFIVSRPVLVAMLLTGLCLLGLVSYKQLPVELIPYAELPMLIVHVGTARDTDPELVEQEAIIVVEGAIGTLDDIERIESYIDRRRGVIFVYYVPGTDLKYAYLRLQQQIDNVAADIGADYFVAVLRVDTEQLANQFATLSVRGGGGLDRLRHIIDRDIVNELESIDGIANVEVYGGRQYSVEVQLQEAALRAHALTSAQITSRLQAAERQWQLAGHVYEGARRYFVNVGADYDDLTQLENTVVKPEGPVLLKHVAKVIAGGAERESISRINGKEAISISLIRETEANLLDLSHTTREVIDRLNRKVAHEDVNLVVTSDAAEIIEENIDQIKLLALLGGILAVIILWLFLRNLPLVLTVAAAIPISVLVALNLFYLFDISINTLTLIGMAVALGMLLDNSIVVLENVYRLVSRGMPAGRAVVQGAREVWRPVFAATLTTICVFLPFIYSGNYLVRILGRQVGVAIISTLLVSLLVAFLLIPAVAGRLLSRRQPGKTKTFNIVRQHNRLLQLYTLLLKSCLRFPARTVIWGLVLFFLSIIVVLGMSMSLPAEVEIDEFQLYAQLPSGTTLASTDEQVAEMEKRLDDIAEIEERLATIEEEEAVFTFRLKEDYQELNQRDMAAIKEDISERLDEAFPRVNFSYEQPAADVRYRGGGGPRAGAFLRLLGIGTPDERVIVRGPDLTLLRLIADDIQFNLENLQTVDRTGLDISRQQPELRLVLDKAAFAHFDVALTSVAAELAVFQQDYVSGVTVRQGTEDVEVVIKNQDLQDKTSDELLSLAVPSQSGGLVPLQQLADPYYASGYWSINRVNQEHQIELSYLFSSEIRESKELLEQARAEVRNVVAALELPPGVSVEVVHEDTDYSEFYFLLAAAFLLIYMILASVFESLTTPLAMMFSIPLATSGAFWGLAFAGHSIANANSLLGLLILLGVVVNNGIILVDYARLLRRRGHRWQRALLTAGQARVRPILITTLTTVVAMLPLALGKAEYVGMIGAPFAVAVIGGLSVGTLFTLVFIPAAFSGLENAITWWRQLRLRVRVSQLLILAAGVWLIHQHVESLLWQIIDITALFFAVPAISYLALTSLRRAKSDLVAADQPVRIKIRNVVKNYDDFSRFVQEFRKRERQKARLLREGHLTQESERRQLLWQIPVYLFLLYFVYVRLDSGFWLFLLSHAVFLYTLMLAQTQLLGKGGKMFAGKREPGRWRRFLVRLLYWGIPTANLLLFSSRWENLGPIIYIACLWYPSLLIYAASRKLHDRKIRISEVKGRFATLRRMFYRQVMRVPVIGRRRHPFRALDRVSLEIGSGMFGLIGPNGAGKTTLMRIICGVLGPTRGRVTINGIDLERYREELQAMIGYLPQEFGLYQSMSAYQFLDYQALLKGVWDQRRRRKVVEEALRSVHLESERDTRIGSFSGGMKQRVGIAQTLLHLPRILVVDEPTAGLDPTERIRFRNLLAGLARDRIVIFSTHVIEDISSSCSQVAVLDEGRVKFLGQPRELAARAQGHVWTASVAAADFDTIRQRFRVVHHLRDGDFIKVRILAAQLPLPDAVAARPTLEDSYLWLLGKGVMA